MAKDKKTKTKTIRINAKRNYGLFSINDVTFEAIPLARRDALKMSWDDTPTADVIEAVLTALRKRARGNAKIDNEFLDKIAFKDLSRIIFVLRQPHQHKKKDENGRLMTVSDVRAYEQALAIDNGEVEITIQGLPMTIGEMMVGSHLQKKIINETDYQKEQQLRLQMIEMQDGAYKASVLARISDKDKAKINNDIQAWMDSLPENVITDIYSFIMRPDGFEEEDTKNK